MGKKTLLGIGLLLMSLGQVNAQARPGVLELYLFGPDGLAWEGVTIEADGQLATTDSEGHLTLSLAPGPRELALRHQGQDLGTLSVLIRSGQTTESMVNLRRDRLSSASPESTPEVVAPTPEASSVEWGEVRGTVVHWETRKPVEGATVLVRGSDREARTDARGQFALQAPRGQATLSIVHPLFATQTIAEVAVGETVALVEVELTPSALQLESVSVFSASEIMVQGGVSALVEEAKNSGVVLNLLGSEQISRTGDSDAAQALGRVTGLTVVDGKDVYVRGMGDRYASSLLNGARLPSPETDKRVVPLDLFPTAVLESLAIQKTYSADLYGDFGGGAVSLRTVGVPDDRFKRRLRGSVSFSLGFDLDTLFQTKTLGKGGSLDWLGIDDGTRDLPATVKGLPAPLKEYDPTTGVGVGTSDLLAASQSFSNTWGDEDVVFLPNPSITFTLRDQYDLGDRRFGWSAALLAKHTLEESVQATKAYGDTEGTLVTQDFDVTTVGREVEAGALVNLEYQDPVWGNWESTSFGTRLTNQQRVTAEGQDKELPQAILTDTSWVEQTLLNQRFSGEVRLPGGWGTRVQYSLSWARRHEPDHQYVGYGREDDDEDYTTNERVGRPYRLYTEVEDLIHDAQVKLSIPLAFLGWGDHSVDVGGQAIRQDRTSETRRFSFKVTENSSLPPEDLFDPDNVGVDPSSPVRFSESTLSTDQYSADHSVLAGFAILDLILWGDIRLSVGNRLEWSRQSVFTYDLYNGTGDEALLETTDWLPSVNLTVPLGERWQARLGGSRTVNRPDLRELSAAPKDGTPGTGQFVGNPDLRRAEIWAGDLRLENYLTPTETWAVGVFYKDFTDAIELLQVASASTIRTPVNVPKAYNLGAELEWNVTLAGVSDVLRHFEAPKKAQSTAEFWSQRQSMAFWGNFWRDLTLSGNFALIRSEIDYAGQPRGISTSSSRPLQGQSPYVLNLSLTYKNSVSWSLRVKSDTQVTLAYNLFGPRIVTLGSQGFPDSYEQEFHQLDLTLKHRFDESWSMDLKAKNLLDLPAVIKAGDLVIEEQTKGRSFNLGVKYEF